MTVKVVVLTHVLHHAKGQVLLYRVLIVQALVKTHATIVVRNHVVTLAKVRVLLDVPAVVLANVLVHVN